MSYQLRLIFTGLCTFVEHTDGKRCKVLLVDGRRQNADPLPATAGAPSTLAHCCGAIRYNFADLDPASPRQPDLSRDGVGLIRLASLPTEQLPDSLSFVEGGDLTVQAVGGSLTTPFQIAGTPGPPPAVEPTTATRSEWSWVADLESLRPGAGAAQPWWFANKPMPPGSSISPILARLELDRGVLSTLEFFRDSNPNKPNIFRFQGGARRQAVASFVQCVSDVTDGTQVQIASTPFGSTTAGEPLTFLAPPPGGMLTLQFFNAPFHDTMREFFPGTANYWNFPFTNGHSFLHVYSLQPTLTPGEFPGGAIASAATQALALDFIDKPVGCSPSKTTAFNF